MSEILPSREESSPDRSVYLQKKFNKLKHQALYLDIEHEEILEKFSQYRNDFISAMMSHCHKNKIPPPFSEEEDTPEEKKKSDKAKKTLDNLKANNLFREIVKKIHPDKCGENGDPELYNEAVTAKRKGDFRKILKVAMELNLKIDKISPEIIDHLRAEIKQMQKHIRKMREDIMFQWGQSGEKKRKEIINNLTQHLKPSSPSSNE